MITKTIHYLDRWTGMAAFVASAFAIFCVAWTLDRDVPSAYVGPVSAKVEGDTLVLVHAVRRTRSCRTFASGRYIESYYGERFYLPDVRLSRADLDKLEKVSPGEVRLLIDFPRTKATGQWRYHVALEFFCNPVHELWPITYSYEVPFTLEPKQ